MLRSLAIFAVLGIGVGILSQNVPINAPKQEIAEGRSSSKGQRQPQTRSGGQTTLPSTTTSPEPATPACDEACQQGRLNLKIQNRLAWLTGGLVLVGLLQVAGMVWQAILLKQTRGDVHAQAGWMKSQTDHMSKQAGTMADQVEQVGIQTDILFKSVLIAEAAQKDAISKERPRLSIEIKDFDLGEIPVIKYELTCHGTTPAYIKSSWEMTDFSPIPDFEWVKDAYGFPLRGVPDTISPGTTQHEVFIMGTEREKSTRTARQKAVQGGEAYIHFRVRIVYEDIFEGEHELLFSKLYGLGTTSTTAYSTSGMLGNISLFPEWRNSIYKYGEETQACGDQEP
jgi:hypothetical protein